ncbi:MAG: heme-binding protein [Planctomycetes bacterium]|nr:heme-binding protein [Planctomycetota bacterium]
MLSSIALLLFTAGALASERPGPVPPEKDHADGSDPSAKVVRIRGEDSVKAERDEGGAYKAGPCRFDTPLPDGYPAPTPPDCIEIKRYPSVRRAEFSGSVTPDLGMSIAFFPLFQHISDRKIPMTSPVEVDYAGMGVVLKRDSGDEAPAENNEEPTKKPPTTWTMSFLYRTPDLGPVGADRKRTNVKVVDTSAVTVISLGVRGSQTFGRMRERIEVLQRWLADQSVFEAAGDPRGLYYNGPDVPEFNKWGEVQIPIRLVSDSPPKIETHQGKSDGPKTP